MAGESVPGRQRLRSDRRGRPLGRRHARQRRRPAQGPGPGRSEREERVSPLVGLHAGRVAVGPASPSSDPMPRVAPSSPLWPKKMAGPGSMRPLRPRPSLSHRVPTEGDIHECIRRQVQSPGGSPPERSSYHSRRATIRAPARYECRHNTIIRYPYGREPTGIHFSGCFCRAMVLYAGQDRPPIVILKHALYGEGNLRYLGHHAVRYVADHCRIPLETLLAKSTGLTASSGRTRSRLETFGYFDPTAEVKSGTQVAMTPTTRRRILHRHGITLPSFTKGNGEPCIWPVRENRR